MVCKTLLVPIIVLRLFMSSLAIDISHGPTSMLISENIIRTVTMVNLTSTTLYGE